MALVCDGALRILDQTLLPHEEKWIEIRSPDDMIREIQRLGVRGAPLIGVAAALALAQYAESGADQTQLKNAAQKISAARPTAVNLMAAVNRLAPLADNPKRFIAEAEAIFEEDVALCEAMAKRASDFIQDGDRILTHCNTGALATVGVGTALGAIRKAHESGKKIHVFVDETRPLLQGSRLTAWELGKLGIGYSLVCDNMAGALMARGEVRKVFVGADRIARNGDVANKIGTYPLAVLAKYHSIPFYVVAPKSTLDPDCGSGADIPIEIRDGDEVRFGKSPRNCEVWNPAFDVTPRSLISAIILDDRIL
jgi:methylthioribose-1-phosphate isomerase